MSFNIHKWFRNSYLNEEEGFEKNSWEYLTDEEKSDLANTLDAVKKTVAETNL